MYKKITRIAILILWFLFVSGIQQNALSAEEKTEKASRSSLLQFKTPRSLSFCGEQVPLEKADVWERLDREFLLALGRESQVILWIKRSKRYFPLIEERLKHYNMPDDLKYVAVAESDFYPSSLSPKGAAGVWQFISETGKRFGLKKQDRIDERYSFPKSTDAALSYLSFLYGLFGKWALAVAAYNCGEERVKRELAEQGVSSYYDLVLPQETEEFLFRIYAIKIILSNPAYYSFELEENDFYPPFDARQISFYAPQPLHIRVIAEAAQTTFREIRRLNPELRGHHLPEGSYTLFIPRKNSEKFQERLKSRIAESGRTNKTSSQRLQ